MLAVTTLAAFILDLIFGDPKTIPHPVVFIGKMIAFGEKSIRKVTPQKKVWEFLAGAVVTIAVVSISAAIPALIIFLAYKINIILAAVLNIFLSFQMIAAKSLKDAAITVHKTLEGNDIKSAREKLSHIVGRDTEALSEKNIIKATVETVAENSSDGVIAPLFYMIIGGAPLVYLYKAVNTLDSMIGYKNERYQYFGKFAARFDDLLNLIPARITGVLYILSAYILRYDYRNAFKIFVRDRCNHISPNSAQIESACAGALNIQLGGDSLYFSKLVHKKTIGDDRKSHTPKDIIAAVRLMYTSAILAVIIFASARLVFNIIAL